MNRKLLLIVVAIASIGTASAQDDMGVLAFTGRVVQDACSTGQPAQGFRGGMNACLDAHGRGAVYAQEMAAMQRTTGIAMLDYFAQRDGGSKYVVTREYR